MLCSWEKLFVFAIARCLLWVLHKIQLVWDSLLSLASLERIHNRNILSMFASHAIDDDIFPALKTKANRIALLSNKEGEGRWRKIPIFCSRKALTLAFPFGQNGKMKLRACRWSVARETFMHKVQLILPLWYRRHGKNFKFLMTPPGKKSSYSSSSRSLVSLRKCDPPQVIRQPLKKLWNCRASGLAERTCPDWAMTDFLWSTFSCAIFYIWMNACWNREAKKSRRSLQFFNFLLLPILAGFYFILQCLIWLSAVYD